MGRLTELSQIKGKSVILTEEEYQQCKDFTMASYMDHQSNGRGDQEKQLDILNGKIGEVGFHKLAKPIFTGITDTNFLNSIFGDGYSDFTLKENLRTDVKYLKSDRVYFKLVSGYEILSLVEVSGKRVTYIGSITRGEAIEKCKRRPNAIGDLGYYVNRSLFDSSPF